MFELIGGVVCILLGLNAVWLTVALWMDILERGNPLETMNAGWVSIAGLASIGIVGVIWVGVVLVMRAM